MIRIKILTIGKDKEKWLDDALSLYRMRLTGICTIETVLAKDSRALEKLAGKEKTAVCLDPKGALMNSNGFSDFFFSRVEKGGSKLVLIIGGAEGLPESLRSRSELISLSPLTFTHQMTRLILIEQIYRSFEIRKGSSYHK